MSRMAGGMFHSVRHLTTEMNSLTENYLISFEDMFSTSDRKAWGDVKIILLKANGPAGFYFNAKLIDEIKKIKPDVVHVHDIWSYGVAQISKYCRDNKIPYVVSAHGMLDKWALNNSKIKKQIALFFYVRKYLKHANVIRSLNESETNSIKALNLNNKIVEIPNGIKFFDSYKNIKKLKSENINKKILYLGRIHPKKNLMNLIHAWSKIDQHKRKDWELIIAGWSELGYEDLLKFKVDKLNLNESIKFIGPKFDNEKYELFGEADLFILPSYSEGLPMAVLEAWSMKIPVVMTEECNLSLGFHNNAAIKIETSENSIANTLEQVFAMSSDELDNIGLNGYLLAKRNYESTEVTNKFFQLYSLLTLPNV
jgi:poly(glycerol-phosphate) alpha-glucosyltransferase